MGQNQKNLTKMTTLKNKSELELKEINKNLMPISDKIETKLKFLQEQYNFKLDYAFKPITQEEIEKF